MKSIERFSNRADHYKRFRPHYPAGIIPYLKRQIGLNPSWVIADIGSGTGISSEIFLKNGNTVFGVEPNRKMREIAELQFKNEKKFISVDAAAEATSLEAKSVDLVVSGQAFHWFDRTTCKQEFDRIAKRYAYLLLMWNERDLNSPFQKAYDKALFKFAPGYEKVCQRNIDENAIKDFFFPDVFSYYELPNSQHFDWEGLKGRLLSSSYAPIDTDENYPLLMKYLENLFDEYSLNGNLEFKYICKLYFGPVS